MVTTDENMKEHFIIFMGEDGKFKHICKYEPLKSVELIKEAIDKMKDMTPLEKVLLLEKAKMVNILTDPSARFMVIKLTDEE